MRVAQFFNGVKLCELKSHLHIYSLGKLIL